MICNIEDCKFCADGECRVELFQDSEECRIVRKIPSRPVVDISVTDKFSSADLVSLDLSTASKGQQQKWITRDKKKFIKGQFYYQCRYWNDPLVEVIASKICKDLGIDAMQYSLATVDNMLCSIADFVDRKFIPFRSLDKGDHALSYKGRDRIKFVIDRMQSYCSYSVAQYLADMVLVDFIVGNEDRHFQNFGIGEDGLFPLFDFGLGLFEHDYIYANLSLEQAISKMRKLPFGDWDSTLDLFSEIGTLRKGSIDLSGMIIPNDLGRQYLHWSCEKAGIKLCGI